MTMWLDGELYIMESTSNPWPLTCKYWPGNEDVMKTPWDQWIKNAIGANFLVVIFPLKPKYQALFNESLALDFFHSVEGLPYGFSNFIFGWIDTPSDNYPPPLTEALVAVVFSLVDRIYPAGANTMYMNGLNYRLEMLGLPMCDYMECVFEALESRNLSFGAIMAIPELDSFVYPDGKNMVCDVFVLSMLKAGGIFGSLATQMQASEQTPRDCYMMDLWDKSWQRPSVCQVDKLPYCQLMGDYYFDIPDWSTIPPYKSMNQKCQSLPVEYDRCPGIPPSDVSCTC